VKRRQQRNRSDADHVTAKLPRSKRSAITELSSRLDQALAALQSQQQSIDELAATVRTLQTQQDDKNGAIQRHLQELELRQQQALDAFRAHQQQEHERLRRIQAALETQRDELEKRETTFPLGANDTRWSVSETSLGNAR
jgi:ABC-type transporter Mla subunit MlaD